ncbi:MAG: Fur family transcriptional regulator [Candidatus Levybacteria bacterium]|nr:Fur family transcriptional regulator [Candidatus Levybacteria bacterium]
MNIFSDAIRSKGLRVTPARIAVLSVLEDSEHPLDITGIISKVIKLKVDADQATIYRIIENFIDKDLVKRLQFREKKFYYEAKRYDHHHAICEKCGKIDDISNCSIDRVEREIERTKGFKVKSHSLEYFGTCKSCQTLIS